MARKKGPCAVVAGNLHTDICVHGLPRIPGPGEQCCGGRLTIGPGGKSRNIAEMMAVLLGKGMVAMIGRTCRDGFGLWRVPVDALRDAGVDTRKIHISRRTGGFPSIALIAVDRAGRNQICVAPGPAAALSAADVDAAGPLLDDAAANGGMCVLTLELPPAAAAKLLAEADRRGMPVILDPGGMGPDTDISALFRHPPAVLKPNEHEAELLTGIHVRGFLSARRAATMLLRQGAGTVLITHGRRGGYLFTGRTALKIPAPPVPPSENHDSTGCGDQVTAALAAFLVQGHPTVAAASRAIAAGTLQFCRRGISPVSRRELARFIGPRTKELQ